MKVGNGEMRSEYAAGKVVQITYGIRFHANFLQDI
jgi:hypothetical protein